MKASINQKNIMECFQISYETLSDVSLRVLDKKIFIPQFYTYFSRKEVNKIMVELSNMGIVDPSKTYTLRTGY